MPIAEYYKRAIILTVVKSKRKPSAMEFFHNAMEIRKYLTFVILKDFGIKPKICKQAVEIDMSNLTDPDKLTFEQLLAQCNIEKAELIYPQWFLDIERKRFITIMQNMISNIVQANVIYANTTELLNARKLYQLKAIANCHELLQELSYMIDVLPAIEADKLSRFVIMVNRELALLKGWRKSSKLIQLADKADRLDVNCARSVNNSTNFCNANNNGNANNNNASNVNGVRPGFVATVCQYGIH